MKINKLLALAILGTAVSLNASFVSLITGPNIGEDEYEDKTRGIIISQDIDADGIIDSKDEDLNTKICEYKEVVIPDSDGDGFKDNVDKCINTPKGFVVDAEGCSKEVNLNVLFDTNKDIIKDNSTETIDELVDFLEKHENYTALIEGHTDSDGSASYNMNLSKKRAKAVYNYIVNKGVEANRLSVKWFGESKPLNNNANSSQKEENRRVIAVLKK